VLNISTKSEDTVDPKMKMEVPEQVREFAEKSVDQAEKAISSFMDAAGQVGRGGAGAND
jgi:hypothetical protein